MKPRSCPSSSLVAFHDGIPEPDPSTHPRRLVRAPAMVLSRERGERGQLELLSIGAELRG